VPNPPPRLLDVVRARLELRHASPRTIESYAGWIRRFVRFSGRRHPREMGEREVTVFLSHLATDRHVAASTQNQALAALIFLYGEVLGTPVGWLDDLVRAKRPHHVPTVLSRDEVRRLLGLISGRSRLVAMVLYGSGLRLLEALSLRVKDVDLDRRELVVRKGKGGRDRLTMLPESLVEPLEVGRGVKAGFITGSLQPRRYHSRGAALALGAGDVDGFGAEMRVAQPLQQVVHAPQVESAGIVKAGIPLVIGAAQQEVKGSGVVHV